MSRVVTNSDDDRDGRNAVTRGYVVATRVSAIGMQMAIPPWIGWWADSKLNSAPWFLILGAVIGFTVSMYELVKLAKDSEPPKH